MSFLYGEETEDGVGWDVLLLPIQIGDDYSDGEFLEELDPGEATAEFIRVLLAGFTDYEVIAESLDEVLDMVFEMLATIHRIRPEVTRSEVGWREIPQS